MTDFGVDVSCTASIQSARLSSGLRLVGEALFRRLSTPRGTLRGGEDEANYGLDLQDEIGSVTTKSDAASLAGRVRAECLKDERVQEVTVDVVVTKTQDGVGTVLTVSIAVTTAEGPFDLVIAASAVSVDLLGITLGS